MPKKVSLKRLQTFVPKTPEDSRKNTALKKLKIKAPAKFQNELILAELGISIENEKKDFSLKTVANDKEFIQNPKIVEMDNYKRLEQEYDKPDDKFPNEDDPFYQLDDQRDNFMTNTKLVRVSDESKLEIVNSLVISREIKQLKTL